MEDNKTLWIVGGGAVVLLLLLSRSGGSGSARVASLGPIPRDNSDAGIYSQERVARAGLVAGAFEGLASFALGSRSLATQENLARITTQSTESLARINASSEESLARLQLEGLRRTLAHGSRQSKRQTRADITLAEIQAQTQREAQEYAFRGDRTKNILNAITTGLNDLFSFWPF